MKLNTNLLATYIFFILLSQNKVIEGKHCSNGELCAYWKLNFKCGSKLLNPIKVQPQICYATWFIETIYYCYDWSKVVTTSNPYYFYSYTYVSKVFSFETAVKIEHNCEAHGKGKLSSKSRICYFYPGDVNSHCKRNCASNLYEPTVDLTSPATGAKQICWKEGESGFPVPLLYEN